MDLFEAIPVDSLPGTPLAERMRPHSLEGLIGQKKICEKLLGYVRTGFLPNLIFWGPPGTGKTTAAEALGREFGARLVSVNATSFGVKELRSVGEESWRLRRERQQRTIIFVDEVHRFNKGQQDVLLPYIEKGDLTLIGATTENPSYELNKSILSRCRVLVFERLSLEECEELFQRAWGDFLQQNPSFLGKMEDGELLLDDKARRWLLSWADGDARRLLLAVEEIFYKAIELLKEKKRLTEVELQDILGGLILGHDKHSDSHYDLASALIKSVRGSDFNAALYYLARLLLGGEDILFIARRLVILSSEDVGNADPRALQVAMAGAHAVEFVGRPEADIVLAQMVTYLSSAPKSNRSYMALHKAKALVEAYGSCPVPPHLRSSGEGRAVYKYPHDYHRHWVEQSYFPNEINLDGVNEVLYIPDDIGFEKQIKEYVQWMKGQITR